MKLLSKLYKKNLVWEKWLQRWPQNSILLSKNHIGQNLCDWKTLKIFQASSKILLLMIKLGFFSITLKANDNWCIRIVQNPQKRRKQVWANPKLKVMMIVFLKIQGISFISWVPENHAVNQIYYKVFLKTLMNRWENDDHLGKWIWIFHEDSVPTLNSLPRCFSWNTKS